MQECESLMSELTTGVIGIPAEVENNESPRKSRRGERTSTVGRGKAITRQGAPDVNQWSDSLTNVSFGDSLSYYKDWARPTCIVSDGAYGVLGFEGDTSDHTGMPEWYEPHVAAWATYFHYGVERIIQEAAQDRLP